jgi:tRNA-uridine 2-sulfurtransferase
VFERFLAEHRAGRTPNPDVLCNREIKFNEFVDHAETLGAKTIATGHYVRSALRDHYIALLRGADSNKDQSYFLHALGQDALQSASFPVGEMRKKDVRDYAKARGFATHNKRDSTGICFIGERPFREFLARYIEHSPGPMVTPTGAVVGQHHGLAFYTLGQRQGLGIGGRADAAGGPWYVYGKDLDSNTLFVLQGHDHPLLHCSSVWIEETNWVAGETPPNQFFGTAKTRYRQVDQRCRIEPTGPATAILDFEEPQRAVTPGQSAVIYSGDECLGGGVIVKTAANTARAKKAFC